VEGDGAERRGEGGVLELDFHGAGFSHHFTAPKLSFPSSV
jgi:hypothetical protein